MVYSLANKYSLYFLGLDLLDIKAPTPLSLEAVRPSDYRNNRTLSFE